MSTTMKQGIISLRVEELISFQVLNSNIQDISIFKEMTPSPKKEGFELLHFIDLNNTFKIKWIKHQTPSGILFHIILELVMSMLW